MELLHDVPLSEHTTLHLGGRATFFTTVTSVAELREAVTFARGSNLRFFILGGGSNTLFPDNGFPGLVIHLALKGIEYEEDSMGDVRCTAAAGEVWDALVEDTTNKGLWGLENLSAIPGSIGAAPVQNVGAYGVEVKDRIDWVEVLNTDTSELHIFTVADCAFGYRDSVFKHAPGAHYVVTRVAFRLKTHPDPHLEYKDLARLFEGHDTATLTPRDVRSAIVEIRSRKLPDPEHVGTAGSFFKNPVVTMAQYTSLQSWLGPVPSYAVDEHHVKIPLAWLLEHLGWKGKRAGNMGCWENQPLCLTHYGNGTTDELVLFAHAIAQDVKERANIIVEPEVCIVT